jgi:hypothetical protein
VAYSISKLSIQILQSAHQYSKLQSELQTLTKFSNELQSEILTIGFILYIEDGGPVGLTPHWSFAGSSFLYHTRFLQKLAMLHRSFQVNYNDAWILIK